MHGLKFNKKSNKNSKVAVFHTLLPLFIFVIANHFFNMHKKGPWKVFEFCIGKSVGTMYRTM